MIAAKKHRFKKFLRSLVYCAMAGGIIALAFFGSRDKATTPDENLSMQSIASDNFNITADQLSEFYVVANLATYMNLSNVETLSSNYVAMTVMSAVGQSDASRLEKPNIIDTSNIPRGVIEYVVKEGDSVDSIANAYKLTADQVRWSNGLANTNINIGQVLYIPKVPGIVYTVEAGDTVEALATRYSSTASEISVLLEDGVLREGAMIIIPNGILPETERPEYVAPVRTVATTPTYSYTYYGSSWDRRNLRVIGSCPWCYAGNPYAAGWCTWFAWAWRQQHGMPVSGQLGNASTWASIAGSQGHAVDKSPSYGAIFQNAIWPYGHVGIVVGVNSDGSITVQEMNYNYNLYTITESEIPANQIGNYWYIH